MHGIYKFACILQLELLIYLCDVGNPISGEREKKEKKIPQTMSLFSHQNQLKSAHCMIHVYVCL